MGMEIAVMSGAQRGNRDLPDSQSPGLLGQMRPEIDPSLGALRNRLAKRICDFRTYFITGTTNAYPTMYYET